MKFLKALTGKAPKRATDYEILIGEIDAEIRDLESRHVVLKAALAGAAFEKTPDEIEALRDLVRKVGDDIDFARSTRDEAERRREAAEAEEAGAAIVVRMEAAKADQLALKQAYVTYHEAANELVRQVKTIRELRAKLATANAEASDAGRKDLRVHDPFVMLGQIVPHARNAPGYDGVVNIVDYWPHPHPDGPPLAHIGKLKL